MGETSRRIGSINLLLLILAAAVWVFNAFKVATGLRSMGLMDGLSAGMCFFIGPFILVRWFSEVRRGGNGR